MDATNPDHPPPRSAPITEEREEARAHPYRLLALLIATTAIGPLALNILAPAMPGLIVTLGADAGAVQLTLSLFLLGMAISQLVLGPLSDRFGRRPVMLAGLALAVVTSFAALAASSVGGLIAARTFQAFSATTGLVVGRAIIRDLYDRDRAASMLGWVTMAMVVAPMIAPLLGGVLDTAFGWKAIFAFVGLFAAVVFGWTALALPETRAVVASQGLGRMLSEARFLLSDTTFLGYTLVATFNSAMFFTFIGGAPHVVVTMMHRSSAVYGLWFVAISAMYMLGNFTAGRWSVKYGVDAMIRSGVAITVFGAAVGIGWVLIAPNSGPEMIMTPQMIIALASGFMLPNAIAGGVSVHPQSSGTAAGIMGFMQMGLGAATSQLVGVMLASSATALPLAAVVLTLCACSLVAFFALVRK